MTIREALKERGHDIKPFSGGGGGAPGWARFVPIDDSRAYPVSRDQGASGVPSDPEDEGRS